MTQAKSLSGKGKPETYYNQCKYNAAIFAAERHAEAGQEPMPHVVDEEYREVYLAEYERITGRDVSAA